MKEVLFIDWPCFGKVDAIFTLQQMGYTLTMFSHEKYQERVSLEFDHAFSDILDKKDFDFCFSFNYYPIVAENCKKYDLPYISIVYDSPYVALYSYTIVYPTNYVFIFDSAEYQKLQSMGIQTVHYTVLPVNATIIEHLLTKPYDQVKFNCDVSFVGALYNEAHNFYDRLANVNEYTKGYLEALLEAQLHICGYNFLEEALTEDIIAELFRVSPYDSRNYGIETPAYIYANYFLGRKVSSMERIRLLTAIGTQFPKQLKLFTLDQNVQIPNVQNMGAVDYYEEMPYVFANSKINLNITLKSIQTGIPLRAMDIMGNGGFLLTNYQADLLDYFTPGAEFDFYTNSDELLSKIDYYLSHEKERREIATNGHQKVLQEHSFDLCFKRILDIVFPA